MGLGWVRVGDVGCSGCMWGFWMGWVEWGSVYGRLRIVRLKICLHILKDYDFH